jgi:hypothetical protein
VTPLRPIEFFLLGLIAVGGLVTFIVNRLEKLERKKG